MSSLQRGCVSYRFGEGMQTPTRPRSEVRERLAGHWEVGVTVAFPEGAATSAITDSGAAH